MKCPVDGELLVITERSGVELDYCPRCRGVWLDRGELDKIIDVAAGSSASAPVGGPDTRTTAREQSQPYREVRRENPREDGGTKRRKKRGGFADILEDLFDFD